MKTRGKRGHSNVVAEECVPWDSPPDCAKVPLRGGATFKTCRQLPPLALHRYEWEAIGRRMGWTLAKTKGETR